MRTHAHSRDSETLCRAQSFRVANLPIFANQGGWEDHEWAGLGVPMASGQAWSAQFNPAKLVQIRASVLDARHRDRTRLGFGSPEAILRADLVRRFPWTGRCEYETRVIELEQWAGCEFAAVQSIISHRLS